ncbi:glycosyl transferase group 1 [Clostridium carboxidivorans P7]|uniref:Glycosyl transferase group 1 n=1 Tax=Clostridium carboxidivorans P7 TaxID=536227 RepID=C6PXY2_9CLOT|nr:glycosyltransferase family 4 protein [Clostridium carboxidivorans]EET85920.1 glycosyl transferase group 1 [Clostridium carboxidivorans P7]EFG87913.1 glycosyltransferase, group 1 family protein [Clostridium carboxidivorans P7]
MKKRILILSNHFITLYNFRKELVEKLIEEGNEVFISIPKDKENSFFSDMGCKIIEIPVDRKGVNPVRDIGLALNYIKIMKKLKPDIIFSYTIKPNVYGCIASNFTKNRQVSNITGTGATFLKKNFVSMVAKALYKLSLKKSYKVFFQNSGDKDYFIENKMIKDNWEMLPGSGVNLEQYSLCDLPSEDEINFIFIGRVMKLKGIEQYINCAKSIKEKHPNTNFYIAGFVEEDKYKQIIEEYHKKRIINYIGFQKDIKPWIQKCHCTILPSYGGEGVPNVLLESAAMGRICVASKINGSKDVIDDGVTGYLFEIGNAKDLIDKVDKFLALDNERKKTNGVGWQKES